jgi:hypothetical protein
VIQRARRDQFLGRDERRHDRLERGIEERFAGAVDRHQREQHQERQHPDDGQHADQPDRHGLREVGDQEHAPALEPVGHGAAHEQEQHGRQRPGDADDDSAVGALDSEYVCQAIATNYMPSPSSDTVIPVHSSANSRSRSGDSIIRRGRRGPALLNARQ